MQATEVTGGPRAKRPKNRKAQIALVAAELFCERGYHGVGIDEIAAAIGITGPAVYRHFPNKYAILVHATRELVDATLAATGTLPAARTAVDESPREQLDELLGAIARLSVERRRVGALYQWEGRYLNAEHRAEFRAELATLVDRIVRPLRELRPELTADAANVLTRAALSAFGSLSTHRAAIAKGRAEQLLQSAAWTLLTADPPTAPSGFGAGAGAGVDADPVMRIGSRREILLTEAIRLFRRQGYHAVGMDDIGGAAGINASSVYRYFPGKADLLAAAYYRATERLTGATTAAVAGATDPDDALRRLIEAYVEFTFDESDLVSVYLTENSNLPEPDRHELRKSQRLHVEEWVRLVDGIRPELAAAEARVLVHAALNLATDLGRMVRFDRATGFDTYLSRLALAVLRHA